MSTATSQMVFPLLTTGLSRSFTRWLRTAGVSVKDYVPGSSLVDFFRENRGRILVFDSRNPSARLEAETAGQFDCETLDVNPQATGSPRHFNKDSAAGWILHVSQLVRNRHRFWLRIHDLPAGYEAIVFQDGLPRSEEFRTVIKGTSILDHPHQTTVLPAPHFRPDHVFSGEEENVDREDLRGCWWKERIQLSADRNQEFLKVPFVWTPTFEQFSQWWQRRSRIHFETVVSDEFIRIHIHGVHPDCPQPLLEVWREDHVARFPVDGSSLVLKRSGMVYEQAAGRHPAGLFLSRGLPAGTETATGAVRRRQRATT